MKRYRFVIIGAGPTGLGAAWRLKSKGVRDFIVLEQEQNAGGLSSTYRDPQGFSWDIGGHILFSRDPLFLDLMRAAIGDDSWLHHERQAFVRLHGSFIPYPLQNNLRYLPEAVLSRCLNDLEAAAGRNSPVPDDASFYDWLVDRFGAGLVESFFLPYNRKVWAYHPSRLSWRWIGERVAPPDVERIRKTLSNGEDDVSWGPNNQFRYPKTGGTGAIWKSVAELIGQDRILYGARVDAVNPVERRLTLTSGECIEFEHLLSTKPLNLLCQSLVPQSPVIDEVRELSRKLLFSSCHVVGLGLRGKPPEALKTKSWIYFPEGDCPFYRVTVLSNYSSALVPDPQNNWSLLAETSASPEKPVSYGDIVEETLTGLLRVGLISSRSDVESLWSHFAEYAYPTPSLDRDQLLKGILPALERFQIYSRGRFGAWKYENGNQDHCCLQGIEWSDQMVGGMKP